MFVLRAKALSGRELIEKIDNAQDAHEKARRWLGSGFTDVCLSYEGGPWHHGAQEIWAFIDQLKPTYRLKPGSKEAPKRGPGDAI